MNLKMKDKEKKLVRLKVAQTLLTTSGFSGLCDLRVEVISRSHISQSVLDGGLIIAVDAPFKLVRNVNTFILTKINFFGNSLISMRDEFEAIFSVDGLYRKSMKQLLQELIPLGRFFSSSDNPFISIDIFSIIDGMIDRLSFYPQYLERAKLI
jgi:hypothetical protein